MTDKKQGVIQDVRYEADSDGGVVHIDGTDGVHTAVLSSEKIKELRYEKGMEVEYWLGSNGEVQALLPKAQK
jgi:hypothetical protein